MPIIFALSGLSESGKSSTGKYLASRGIRRLKIATFMREIQSKGGGTEDLNEWIFRNEVQRPQWLLAQFADTLLKYAAAHNLTALSIESLYGPVLARYLKGRFGDAFVVVWVDIPYETRLRRQVEREQLSSIQEARAYLDPRDAIKIEKGIVTVQEMADERLDNAGTLEQLWRQIDEILARHHVSKAVVPFEGGADA